MHRVSRPLSLAALLWAGLVSAQFQPRLNDLSQLPLHAAPAQWVSKAVQQAQAHKGRPFQFGVMAPLAVGLDGGVWGLLPDGRWSWRTRVFSAGARSLHLEFSRFAMPEGGELYVYNASGQLVQGPYTHANQTAQGLLATALVLGETAVIEARLPAAAKSAFALELGRVGHHYEDMAKASSGAKSGSCNIDTACTQGNNWRNEIQSVAALQITADCNDDGIDDVCVCTGTLMNNTRQDRDPLLLTANHCDLRNNNASTLVVYWNYQTSPCGGSPNGALNQNQSGSVFLGRDETADYSIVRLNQNPATNPAISPAVYFAGWDASNGGASCGAGIHHPSGDEKRISLYTGAVSSQDGACIAANATGGCAFRVNAWKVYWSEGVTEGGSSGSGLWSQQRQVIGVLSGGASACGVAPADLFDYYGRLEAAFAATDSLRSYLAPGTSTTSLCGRTVNAVCDVNATVSNPCGAGGGPALGGNTEGGGAYGSGALTVQLFLLGLGALTRRLRRRG